MSKQQAKQTKAEEKPTKEMEEEKEKVQVTYSVSPHLHPFLAKHNIALLFTSYQSGKLYMISRNPQGGIMTNEQNYKKAMGLFVEDQSIYMAGLHEIIRFENILKKGERANQLFDACFMPRISYNTGILDAHDVGKDKNGEILFVNTRFNNISKLSTKHSFEVFWKPDFITEIIDEDRCHLNGMAMHEGEARFATAVSRSNTIDGWRDRRDNGGIILDIKKNKIICKGLSMPHSPRVHDGKLWVLNSGTGELGYIKDYESGEGTFEPVIFCPGFVRGLSFYNGYAIVGLSKPRYQRFEGLELDQRLEEADSEPWCGVQIIDLNKKKVEAWFRIDGAIGELYDVNIIEGFECAMSLGYDMPDVRALISHPDSVAKSIEETNAEKNEGK